MVANETEIVIRLNKAQCEFPYLRGMTSESCHKAPRIEILSPQAETIIFFQLCLNRIFRFIRNSFRIYFLASIHDKEGVWRFSINVSSFCNAATESHPNHRRLTPPPLLPQEE